MTCVLAFIKLETNHALFVFTAVKRFDEVNGSNALIILNIAITLKKIVVTC